MVSNTLLKPKAQDRTQMYLIGVCVVVVSALGVEMHGGGNSLVSDGGAVRDGKSS